MQNFEEKALEGFTFSDGQKRSAISQSQLEELFTSFQLGHEPTSEASCLLCNLDLTKERVHYNNGAILIVDTKAKKGHKERIMLLTRKHGVQHDKENLNKAVEKLISVSRQIFNEDFALLTDRFSSTNYHWHIVVSDIDPKADDYQQIMKTPYVLIPKK